MDHLPAVRLVFAAVAWTTVVGGCAPVRVPAPVHPEGSSPPAQAALEALRDGFVDRVRQLGIELPYRPGIREWTRPSLISWREEARAVAVPRWADLNGSTRRLFSGCVDRRLFRWAFRWFFPIHELAHFLQSEFGWRDRPSASERAANDLAVAFHRSWPGGDERLEVFSRMIEGAVTCFADPTPPGQDRDAHFDAHYHELGRQPELYGAYQWRFVLDSLRRAPELEFGSVVKNILRRSPLPTAVQLDASRDVGFHVAAHLNLPGVAITLHDPSYVLRVAAARRSLGIPDLLLVSQSPRLSARLRMAWRVHRLVRVPALFDDFADTRLAFEVLLGTEQPSADDVRVVRRLEEYLLPLYPFLETLTPAEKQLGRELAAVIDYEYESFHQAFHRSHREKWDWSRRRFREAWQREIAPAVTALDPGDQIRQVVIVLSPALRRHGKSFRIVKGIGRVATLLPENPAEMEHALLYALHELCHGITDPIVFAAGYRREDLSFQDGEPGKSLHLLIEAAANQAMYLALGATNPAMQTRFLEGFGGLSWLAEGDRLREQLEATGRRLPAEKMAEILDGLRARPVRASRQIYEQGLLVPPAILDRLRALVLVE